MKKNINNFEFDFPAVKISINDKIYIPNSANFENDELIIHTSLRKEKNKIWKKRVEVIAKTPLPTPDYIEVDRQTISDNTMKCCGYVASRQMNSKNSEEESGGIIPGCGYPLVGKNMFVGLEHQAGFNKIESQDDNSTTYSLRHHPVWNDNKLEVCEAVIGFSENAEQLFWEYLEDIRVPIKLDPFFAFCSFWSDPYIGNYEYLVTQEGMEKFIKNYDKMNIKPDAYTLDAGWHDRKTIFNPKAGLDLNKFKHLSLWLSHNGPMGFDSEYLKSLGVAIGSGQSAAYCGDDYAILLDKKFEALVTEQFCKLAKKAKHFKIDWDNDCATNDDFNEVYPTVDHVREGSINAMNRIAEAIREVNPNIIIRNGWWLSPWWLKYVQHVFLAQSGDSEYASLPTLHQRSSAATHRDLMYYNALIRDKSFIPLSSFDNHEFPNSIRNAFADENVSWTDNIMLSIMRGSTYLSWTIQGASLNEYQIKVIKQAMNFARSNAKNIFVKNGTMIGGNPGLGEIYGFKQNTWCVLRNPSCMIKDYEVKEDNMMQFYPYFKNYKCGETIEFLPEEVRCFIVSKNAIKLPFNVPFQIVKNEDKFDYYFPFSLTIDKDISPVISSLHQIKDMKFDNVSFDKNNLFFQIIAPYQINDLQIRLKVRGKNFDKQQIRILSSRYKGNNSSNFVIAPTEICVGELGWGEIRNAETAFKEAERYFTFSVPAGGETNICIKFSHDICKEDIDVISFGYENKSRNAKKLKSVPACFKEALPPIHASGFGLCKKLVW